jgi:hypothetical protein
MTCTACTPPPGAAGRVLHQDIPVYTQYATPQRIAAIAYTGDDPADDPAWPTTGAADRAEYGRWCRHCCGMACLQMILHHRDGNTPPLLDLLRAGLPYGTYTTEPDGNIRGMFYAPFAAYLRHEHDLASTVHPHLDLHQLCGELSDHGRLVIASVHKEIRRPDRPPPGKGGHLVLVVGHDPHAATIDFLNPSGHTPDTRRATLPFDVFAGFFGGRGISVTLTRVVPQLST